MAHLDASKVNSITGKLLATNQLCLFFQLLHDLVLLQFRGTLQPFCQCMFGEAHLVDAVDGIADIQEVLDNQQCLLGQKR